MDEPSLQTLREALGTDSPNTPVWIQVGSLFEGADKAAVRDAHLVYNAEKILFVGKADSTPPAELIRADQQEPDMRLAEYTVIPGLIESHAHLFLEGAELDFEKRKAYLELSSDELLEHGRGRMRRLFDFGVMAVRDAGDKNGVGLALAAEYRTGERSPIPYIDSPGAAIHHKGRYGSFMGEPFEDYETVEDCVEGRIRKGADRIKLIPTGIIDFEKGKVTAAPQMTADEVRAFVRASIKRGKQTFAHGSGSDGIENAIEGGVDSVEHGFFITQVQLAKMRDRDIAWVPTFTPVQAQVDHADAMGSSEKIVGHLQRILDSHSGSLVHAKEIGVRIIAGSDAGSCGVAHGGGFLDELERMESGGLASRAVLHAATGAAAERLGFREPIGILEPGAKPRFILTHHDPFETVANLRKEKLGVFDGRILESEGNPSFAGM